MSMSKDKLLGNDMDQDEVEGMPPEIIAFMVFKQIRENQQFSVHEAITMANQLFNKYPPQKVV